MVESEAVVDEETLKAEEEKEKTEELEEGKGSDANREVRVETLRLGSEDGSKVSGDKGMEDVGKPAEKQDEELEDNCKVITETKAIRTGNNNEGEVGTRETRRRRKISRRLEGILASDEGLYEEETVDKAGEEPTETDEEMETSQPDQEGGGTMITFLSRADSGRIEQLTKLQILPKDQRTQPPQLNPVPTSHLPHKKLMPNQKYHREKMSRNLRKRPNINRKGRERGNNQPN